MRDAISSTFILNEWVIRTEFMWWHHIVKLDQLFTIFSFTF